MREEKIVNTVLCVSLRHGCKKGGEVVSTVVPQQEGSLFEYRLVSFVWTSRALPVHVLGTLGYSSHSLKPYMLR